MFRKQPFFFALSLLLFASGLEAMGPQSIRRYCKEALRNSKKEMLQKERSRGLADYGTYLFKSDSARYDRLRGFLHRVRFNYLSTGDWAAYLIRKNLGLRVSELPVIEKDVPNLFDDETHTQTFRDSIETEVREQIEKFEYFLKALQQPLSRPLRWVDVGAGRAIALSQAKTKMKDKLQATAVDRTNWGIQDRRLNLIIGEADKVNLDRPDLVTMVEAHQYTFDKLKTFVHLYNQLNDNGFLLIMGEGELLHQARYIQNHEIFMPRSLYDPIMKTLRSAGISFAVSAKMLWPRDTLGGNGNGLMIQKKPGTRLQQNCRLNRLWGNPHGYYFSYYPEGCPIEVFRD